MPDLLLELGLEEVPARMIAAAQAELLKRTLALLTREQIIGSDPIAHAYSTPRRLAVLVHDVRAQQADITEDTTGPAVKIAFKDGVPTPAAEAFARKSGVAVAELKTITTPKGDYLAATTVKKGRPAADVLASELPKEIAAIYWAKNMYWRAGKPERFVRPVLWIACLLGDEVVPVTFAGKTAGRASFGHRVLSSGEPFEIQSPDSYLAQLEGEYVLADVEARRHRIRKALDHVTRTVPGLRWREDHALVDAVTHLTEWPDVLLGSFDPTYLTLPEEVLVTVMRDHQKYFALETADGKLAPYFLTVTNIALDETNTAIIKQGNERVLRARFNDARFFWDYDQRISLIDRLDMLKTVTFQKEIGSYWDKSESLYRIVQELGATSVGRGGILDPATQHELEMAARIAKTDLTTELVKEFTDLEGRIGGLYARVAGLGETVAECVYWQYEPRNTSSVIPPSAAAQLLGLADRMNTVVDMIALGNLPTGSKDPFSIRRIANGIVKILAEGSTCLRLTDTYNAAAKQSRFGMVASTETQCWQFLEERVEFYLRDTRGFSIDVVRAVMAAGSDEIADAVARSQAVTDARGSEDFLSVSAAFKRMKNILGQAYTSDYLIAKEVDPSLFVDRAEKDLAIRAGLTSLEISELCLRRDYATALNKIAQLRPVIDAFFDTVMVMAPDVYLRANRLALISRTVSDFSRIADFSEIVTAG
jgi:glycyl-tRNA synthetase beta chain